MHVVAEYKQTGAVVLFQKPTHAVFDIWSILTPEVIIIGCFFVFIILVISYHCFLKKQRRREVMAKILNEVVVVVVVAVVAFPCVGF